MVTIFATETAVHYRRGVARGVLTPGKHRFWGFGHRVIRVDARLRLFEIKTQEVLTSDGVTVKASASCRLQVADPIAYLDVSEDPRGLMYETLKTWLRESIRPLSVDDLAAGITVDELPEPIAQVASEIGLTVTDLTVRDIVLPPAVRKAAEELLAARRQALVDLERARSETAVLRALANTASMLADNPQLAALRLVETAAAHGASIVIERPASTS